MEAAGLAVGAIALASLFSTCVECFECYEAARDAEEDLKTILVKLDLEKTRLLIWGDQVGVLKTTQQGRSKYLDEFNKQLQQVFERLNYLLTRSDESRESYGRILRTQQDHTIGMIRDDLSRSSKRLFVSSWDDFKTKFGPKINTALEKPTLRIRWAITGKRQFEALVLEVRGFIDSLNDYVKLPRQTVDSIVYREITLVDDLTRLRLVEGASEGVYTSWAERARTVISQSEAGTLDHRETEEVLHDTSDPPIVPRSVETNSSAYLSLPNHARLVFVLTENCSKLATDKPCSQVKFDGDALLIDAITGSRSQYAHEADWRSDWSIGSICLKAIEPSDPVQWQKWEMEFASSRNGGTVLIYCPPCVCQVHTAFSLIRSSWGDSPLVSIKIRVDDRIRSSCCDHGSRRANIRDLRPRLRNANSLPADTFDRPWLDKRLYDMGEAGSEEVELPVSKQSAGDYRHPGHVWPPLLQVIVLGECDSMADVLNSAPFRREARMPKANHIYLMGVTSNQERKLLGEFDPNPITHEAQWRAKVAKDYAMYVGGKKRKLDDDPVLGNE